MRFENRYLVKPWTNGRAGDYKRVYATSKQEAGEMVLGMSLSESGSERNLRALVRQVGEHNMPTPFYAVGR